MCFLAACLWDLVAGAVLVLSLAVGVVEVADCGLAAMDAAARPKVSNAVVTRVADLFMRSPNGG